MLIQARIKTEKPNISALRQKGCTIVDLHSHTTCSDGIMEVRELLDKAKKLGIGLAITDHNEIKGSLHALKHPRDVMVIPGLEFHPFEGMHLLAYFYNEHEMTEFYRKHIEKYKGSNCLANLNVNSEELVEAAKDYNCIISGAHPFAIGWVGLCKHDGNDRLDQRLLQKIDALEVINGGNLQRWNKKAIKIAYDTPISITGGSDAHTLPEVGSVVTYTLQAHTREEFLDAIRNHTNIVCGKPLRFTKRAGVQYTKIQQTSVKSGTRLRSGWSYFKHHSLIRKKRKLLNIWEKFKVAMKRKE